MKLSLKSDLPSNIDQLVTDKKVTYRGCGLTSDNVRIATNNKEYTITKELFLYFDNLQSLRFKAPARKHT